MSKAAEAPPRDRKRPRPPPKGRKQEQEVSNLTAFFGQLPFMATEEELKQHLASHKISTSRVRLLTDKSTGKSRGATEGLVIQLRPRGLRLTAAAMRRDRVR